MAFAPGDMPLNGHPSVSSLSWPALEKFYHQMYRLASYACCMLERVPDLSSTLGMCLTQQQTQNPVLLTREQPSEHSLQLLASGALSAVSECAVGALKGGQLSQPLDWRYLCEVAWLPAIIVKPLNNDAECEYEKQEARSECS